MADKPKVKEIFHELAKKAGLPDDQAKAWLATLDNEQLQNALGEVVMTRSDYSRAMDEVKKTRESAEAEKQKYETTHNQQVVWYSDNKRALDEYPTLKKQLEAYRTLYGELDPTTVAPTGTPATTAEPVNGKYATPDDVQKAKLDIWSLQEQLMEAQENYQAVFGKPMPVAKYRALKEFAMKPENANRPLTDVYDKFMAPDIKAAQEKAIEDRIAKEVAAARADERSKRTFPDETGQAPDEEVSPLYRPIPKEPPVADEIALQKEFIQGLYEKSPASP